LEIKEGFMHCGQPDASHNTIGCFAAEGFYSLKIIIQAGCPTRVLIGSTTATGHAKQHYFIDGIPNNKTPCRNLESFRFSRPVTTSRYSVVTGMATQGRFTSYHGLIQEVPDDASVGLQFLALWLKVIDTLDQSSTPTSLATMLAPSAAIKTNGIAASTDQIVQMLDHRQMMLSAFSHQQHPISAFDLELAGGKRTLTCESISRFVL
jgi:hypothetical protein